MGGSQSHKLPVEQELKPHLKQEPQQYTVTLPGEKFIVSDGHKVKLFDNNYFSKNLRTDTEADDIMHQSVDLGQLSKNNNSNNSKQNAGFVEKKRSTLTQSQLVDYSQQNYDSTEAKSQQSESIGDKLSQQTQQSSQNLSQLQQQEKQQTPSFKKRPSLHRRGPKTSVDLDNNNNIGSSNKIGSAHSLYQQHKFNQNSEFNNIKTNESLSKNITQKLSNTTSFTGKNDSGIKTNKPVKIIHVRGNKSQILNQSKLTQQQQKEPGNNLNVQATSPKQGIKKKRSDSLQKREQEKQLQTPSKQESRAYIQTEGQDKREGTPSFKRRIFKINSTHQKPTHQQDNNNNNPGRYGNKTLLGQQNNNMQDLTQGVTDFKAVQTIQDMPKKYSILNKNPFNPGKSKLLTEHQEFENNRRQIKQQLEKQKIENEKKLSEVRGGNNKSKLNNSNIGSIDLLDEFDKQLDQNQALYQQQQKQQELQKKPSNTNMKLHATGSTRNLQHQKVPPIQRSSTQQQQQKQQQGGSIKKPEPINKASQKCTEPLLSQINFVIPGDKNPRGKQQPEFFMLQDMDQIQKFLKIRYNAQSQFSQEKMFFDTVSRKGRFFKSLLLPTQVEEKNQSVYFKTGVCSLQQLIDTRIQYNIKWQNRDQDLTYILHHLIKIVCELQDANLYYQQFNPENIVFDLIKEPKNLEQLEVKLLVVDSQCVQTQYSQVIIPPPSNNQQKKKIQESYYENPERLDCLIFSSQFERLQADLQSIAKIVYKVMLSTYPKESQVSNYEDLSLQALEQQFQICQNDYLKAFLKFLKTLLTQDYDQNFIKNWLQEDVKLKYLVDKSNNTWKKAMDTVDEQQNKKKQTIDDLILELEICKLFDIPKKDEKIINEIVFKIFKEQDDIEEKEGNKLLNEYIQEKKDGHQIILEIAEFYEKKHKFKKAVQFYGVVQAYLLKFFGEKSFQNAKLMISLGKLNRQRSQFEISEKQLNQALDILKSILVNKDNSALVAEIMHEMGLLWQEQNDTEKMHKYFLEEIKILENSQKQKLSTNQNLHSQKQRIMENYNILGRMFQNSEDFKQAQEFFMKCVDLQKSQQGQGNQFGNKNYFKDAEQEQIQYGATLQNLGMVCESLGQHKKAEKYYLDSVDVLEKCYKSDGTKMAPYYQNLGRLYFTMNQQEKSEEWYKKSHNLYLRNFDEDDFMMY